MKSFQLYQSQKQNVPVYEKRFNAIWNGISLLPALTVHVTSEIYHDLCI